MVGDILAMMLSAVVFMAGIFAVFFLGGYLLIMLIIDIVGEIRENWKQCR